MHPWQCTDVRTNPCCHSLFLRLQLERRPRKSYNIHCNTVADPGVAPGIESLGSGVLRSLSAEAPARDGFNGIVGQKSRTAEATARPLRRRARAVPSSRQ